MAKTATPDKSFIAVNINLSHTGSSVRQSIKFINRKGKFIYSPTCDTCAHQGKVQDNLSFGKLSPTCDRDMEKKGNWRHSTIGFVKPVECKHFKPKAGTP